MFGLNSLNFKIRGQKKHMDKFVDTLRAERAYMEAYQNAGLANPSVINNKSRLERAVKRFEAATNIKWPIR